MSESTTRSSGIGFTGLLTIVFITLKLTGFIDWSWFWVLSPILLPVLLLVSIIAVAFAVGWLDEYWKRRRQEK